MEDEYKIENLVKITIIIMLIIIAFYGLTIIITNIKNEESESTSTDTDIQYDEILIGSIYNQSEDEYYVLVELDSDYLTLSSSVSSYQKSDDAIKLYIANLSDGLNKKYYGDTSDFTGEYPIFSQSTLIRISSKQIVEYIEGTDDIQKALE